MKKSKISLVDFVRDSLKEQTAQVHKGSNYQSCLWTVIGNIRLRYPAWTMEESWSRLDAIVTNHLGGWGEWEAAWNQPTLSKQETSEDEVAMLFCESWKKFHPTDGLLIKSAARKFHASSFDLPSLPFRRSRDYQAFLRFLGYVSLYVQRSVRLGVVTLAENLGVSKNSITKWIRWAVGEDLLEKTADHVFLGTNNPRNRAAKYRISRQLRNLAHAENHLLELDLGTKMGHLYSFSIPVYSSPTSSTSVNDSERGGTRECPRSSVSKKSGNQKKLHSRWTEMAEFLEKTCSTGKASNKNLRASAEAFRDLHRKGGGERKEKPSIKEIWTALRAHRQIVRDRGEYRKVTPEWPVVGSGRSFREKWEGVKGAIFRDQPKDEAGEGPKFKFKTKVVKAVGPHVPSWKRGLR